MPADETAADWRPDSRAGRLVRAVAASVVCTMTAVSGHVLAGGVVPDAGVAACFVGATAVAWLLSTRRVTAGQVVGLLLLTQVVVHTTCSGTTMDMSAGMLLGHAAATALSAAALARGERYAWAIAERLGLRASPLLLVPSTVPAHRTARAVPVTTRSRRDVLLTHSRVERGPPVGVR